MFRKLMNFSYRRTALQALGWYLSFLFFGGVFGGVAATVAEQFKSTPSATFSEAFQNGVPVGQWVSMVYPIPLAIALLWSRWKSALNVFLALAAVLLGLLVGSLGGLIPLAVLTIRHYREKSSEDVAGVFE